MPPIPIIIRQPNTGINNNSTQNIWSAAVFAFFGAMKRATQCGATMEPNAFERNVEIMALTPKTPHEEPRTPASRAGCPSIAGAVVKATCLHAALFRRYINKRQEKSVLNLK